MYKDFKILVYIEYVNYISNKLTSHISFLILNNILI